MMRFTLRDLFWVMTLVAMGVAWRIDHMASSASQFEAVQQTHRHRSALQEAFRSHSLAMEIMNADGCTMWPHPVEWNVLEEPIAEP